MRRLTKSSITSKIRTKPSAWLYSGLILSAIFTAAICTRFGLLWTSPDRTWPHSIGFEGDGPLWVRFASSLQHGEPFEFNLPIHTPGMAYLMAWIWNGDMSKGFLPEKVLLCIISSLSCVLIWILARRMFNDRVAIVAGLLSAASFASAVQAASLNNEAPYTFLLLIICMWTLFLVSHRSVAGLALLGVLNGLAVLFRAEHSLFFVMLCVYLVWRWRQGNRTERHKSLSAPRGGGTTEPAARMPQKVDRTSETFIRDSKSIGETLVPRRNRRQSTAIGLAVLIAAYFLIPLPWNIRSYRAIQRFNTTEPRPINYSAARLSWTPQAIEFIRGLPAFAREGNFLFLTDLAASNRRPEVTREFVEDWFKNQAGYVPQPLSPYVFVNIQGPLSFALANNALAEGGFSTRLLDPQRAVRLAFGNPRHLQLVEHGYAIGLRYLTQHPRDGVRLIADKLAIFASGLTQGITPSNFPLGAEGLRRPADQMGPLPGTGYAWTVPALALAAIGLCILARRHAGGVCVLVIAYKVLVAMAFYGYIREAASILPYFFVLIAVSLDTILLAPLLWLWPRLGKGRSALVSIASAIVVATALLSARHTPRYDVSGSVDPTPLWGPGAFESQQPLVVRQAKY